MIIPGRVRDGVVVLAEGSALPEGAAVSITYPSLIEEKTGRAKQRIQVPLVRSDHPGSLDLTAERIAQILSEDDVPSGR